MKKHLAFIFLILMLAANSLQAQDVKFTVSGQNNVAVGDQFIIQFTVNAQGRSFQGPDFSGLKVLSGPNQSTQSSFSNINGRMTQSTIVTYTYYLRADKEGKFTIAPAKITVDGKEYKTDPLTITVDKEKKRTQPPTGNQNGSGSTTQQLDEDAVYIKAFVDKKTPYLGEQVILTYKIYTRVPISNFSNEKAPNLNGFWMKNLDDQGQELAQSREIINGEEYITAEIRKFVIFPQKSGEVTISPMELECLEQVQKQRSNRRRSNSIFDDFFDDPFFRGSQNVKRFLKSNSIKLNVKPLPQNGKPLSFNGTVGNFKITSSIDNTSVKTNDAISLKYTISGQGNIELIDRLNINFPTDFEVYDPKISDNVKSTSNGVSGSRTFEYLIIPRNPGEFTIPAIDFTFFNPTTQKYETDRTKAFSINVEKSADYQSGVSYSGAVKEDIQYIGQDIRHIKVKPMPLQPIGNFIYGSTFFILGYLIPIVLFILIIIIWRKQAAKRSDLSLMRHKKATKVARRSLRKANQFLGTKESEAFYNEISQALWGYLADKFNISLAELSKDTVQEKLAAKKVKEKTLKQFIECLDHCDYARFAPGDPSSTMDKIYDEALEIISKIERELK